jgi:hypothetical protein
MSTIERFLLVSAVVLFVIVFYRWLMRFLRRKDLQGSFPYVFPFEGALSGRAFLKVDLPNRTMVSPEILSEEGSVIVKFPDKELSAGLHSIELDLANIDPGVYELKIRFSNQTSRIKIEIEK